MVAPGVVVVDEDCDFPLQRPGCLPDDEVDAFLAGAMVTFDLSVGLGMVGI